MRRLSLALALFGLLLLPALASAKPMWRVTGKISQSWAKQLAVRHTTNLLGNKSFTLQHVRSGRDKLFTEHFKATPSGKGRFKPFAVHVQRAKIQPAVIAPRGTSRVSFGALQGLYGKKR